MTWVLYILFMNDDRKFQGVVSSKYFLTEQECHQHYTDYKGQIDKLIKKVIDNQELIHVGCMRTTSKMEIK